MGRPIRDSNTSLRRSGRRHRIPFDRRSIGEVLVALKTRLLTKRDIDEGLRFAKRCSRHSSSASSSG
jgi:hypothetical protein